MTPLGGFVLGVVATLVVEVAIYLWIVTHFFPNKGDIKAEPDSANDTI